MEIFNLEIDEYTIIILAVVVSAIVFVSFFYLIPNKAALPVEEDEFSNCIKDKRKCDYVFLTNYISTNTVSRIFDSEDKKEILFEKYDEVVKKYRNKVVSEEDFKKDPSLNFAVQFIPKYLSYARAKKTLGETLDNEINVTFIFEKVVFMNKSTWVGTQIQAYLLRNTVRLGTFRPVTYYFPDGQMTFSIADTVCNILPTLEDVKKNPSSFYLACSIYDMVRVKGYCVQSLTTEENETIEKILSAEYSDANSINCQNQLKNIFSPSLSIV